MASKKTNRSPFALFMIKMSLEDKSLLKKSFSDRIEYCNQFYTKIDSKEKQKLESLSQLVRSEGLNEKEIFRLIKNSFNSGLNSEIQWKPSNDRSGRMKSDDNKENEEMLVMNDSLRVKTAIESTDLKKSSMIVISFNILIQTIDDKYIPNEIGLTKFTLEDGIQQRYHRLIANAIPSGYYATAKEWSAKSHKIPIDCLDKDFFTKNYGLIHDEVFAFLYSSQLIDCNHKKLIFCKLDDNCPQNRLSELNQIKGCIDWLKSCRQNDCPKNYDMFSFVDLSELLFAISHPLTGKSRAVVAQELSQFSFEYCPKTNCDFHESIDSRVCALGVSQRIVYLFLNSCLQLFPIVCKASHRPMEGIAITSVAQRVEPKVGQSLGINGNDLCYGRGRGRALRIQQRLQHSNTRNQF